MTETTEARPAKDSSKAAPAKRSKAASQGSTRSARKAASQPIKLTPAVEAALAKAAADLPLSPSEIVDTALRDWLRVWYPDLL